MFKHWTSKLQIACYGVLFMCLAFVGGYSLFLPENQPHVFAFTHPELRKDEAVDPLYSSGFYSKEFYDAAYEAASDSEPVSGSKLAIVAHHLLVADEIAAVFETIGDEGAKTVVLISPNHFSVGISPAQVSVEAWMTPYGPVTTDIEAVEDLLLAVPVLNHEEWAFQNEHGIAALTPFVKRSFPKAKIVSIVLDESLSASDAQTLGEVIAEELPKAVVIASVDMSHNLPEYVQTYHDDITQTMIAAGDGATNLEIDSNATLRTLFAINKVRESEVWHETYHGSSLLMNATEDWRENTSHILGYFTEGDPGMSVVSMHFVGDIMLDRGVRKKIDAAGSVAYPWEEMSRFLSGSGLVVGNLEGTVNEQASTYTYNPPFRFVFSPESVAEMAKHIDVVSLANNHSSDVGSAGEIETRTRLDEMGIPWFGAWAEPVPRYDTVLNGLEVTLIGYHQFQPNESALTDEIKKADAEGRFVIVMPHWGTEYSNVPSSSQRRLAQLMVDAGADLIVGGHPHVVQGTEIIDGVPVVYSLGNFVFDQEIPATWNATTLGVKLEEKTGTLYLLPVYTRGGQPVPVSDTEATTIFQTIANASAEEIQSQILNGRLNFSYER